jgi:citrate lyase subunit beta / citryl-CoA lyase
MTRSVSDGPIPADGRLTPRTLLFVPGDRPDRFDKAAAAGADGVIIDLEDSVPAQHKEQARAATAAWLARATAWVRVNPCGTDDFLVDVDRCTAAPGLAGIVVPKAERTQDLDGLTDRVGPAVPVIALIESARGLLAAEAIARHPSVQLIAFGNLDFAADCGLSVESPDELELLPARTHLSVIARAAAIPAARDAARAARLGFSGKLCVGQREARSHTAGALDKQIDCRRFNSGPDGPGGHQPQLLVGDAQSLATGRQDPHGRGPRQDRLDQIGGDIAHVLAVVEHQ